jgi:hypothetical protein
VKFLVDRTAGFAVMVNDWLRSEGPDIRKSPEVAEQLGHLSKLPEYLNFPERRVGRVRRLRREGQFGRLGFREAGLQDLVALVTRAQDVRQANAVAA